MNFLAHFHLAHPIEASRVGALLGDFVRGTPSSLRSHYSDEVIAGIMLHRHIDSFTDNHPIFLGLKKHLDPGRRRFAGIVIDVFFDHFLARDWSDYSNTALPLFIQETHDILKRHGGSFPPGVQQIVETMKAEEWLRTNEDIEGVARTFQRLSRRRDFLSPLLEAQDDLARHYQIFETSFRAFYPELQSFAAAENPGSAFIWP